MKNIISVRKLHVWYNDTHAVDDVSLSIPAMSVTGLIGASGSGKSSLLRCINRMIDVIPLNRTEGEIVFNGDNILKKETDVISLRQHIGMVFQHPTPFPKSIYDNIAYGLQVQGKAKMRHFLFGDKRSGKEIEESTDPMDAQVVVSLKEAALWEEVKNRLHTSALRLSGGQQQRLCIARAIAVRPQVLLLDEPCSELDPISTRKIEELILKLKKKYAIVIVTHNMHQARRISDRIAFFHLGKLIEYDSAKKIFSSPKQELTRHYVQGEFG